MTLSHDTIPAGHADIIVDLFAANAVLTSRLPAHIATNLPAAARLRDAHHLADPCHQDRHRVTVLLTRLDEGTASWDGCQPFQAKHLLTLIRKLGGSVDDGPLAAALTALDIRADKSPAPRTARLVAAAELAVGMRRLRPDDPVLSGAATLPMRHALRSTGLSIPMVEALMTPGPDADAGTLLSSCRTAMERAVAMLDPDRLLPALLDRATADLPDMRPVLAALTPGKPLPRGEVAGLAGLPERTARRKIAALLEAGWLRSDSQKGPLFPDVPPAVLADLLSCKAARNVVPVSK